MNEIEATNALVNSINDISVIGAIILVIIIIFIRLPKILELLKDLKSKKKESDNHPQDCIKHLNILKEDLKKFDEKLNAIHASHLQATATEGLQLVKYDSKIDEIKKDLECVREKITVIEALVKQK